MKILFTILFVCLLSNFAYSQDFGAGLALGAASCDDFNLVLADNVLLKPIKDKISKESITILEKYKCINKWYGISCDERKLTYSFQEYVDLKYPGHDFIGYFDKNGHVQLILKERK